MIRKAVICTIAIVCLLGQQVRANQTEISETKVKESIVKHSLELGIDPALALSIAKSESGFRHDKRSAVGAVGVMQIMPSTAKKLGINPYYLSENIKGGLMYYKRLYNMFGSTELALAAYNAGPGTVKRCGNAIPPYRETRKFVSQIMTEYGHQKSSPDPAISRVKTGNYTPVEFKHAKTAPIAKVQQQKPITLKNVQVQRISVQPVRTPAVVKVPAAPVVLPRQGII
ncbi:MAG: lytic transglycosylase domain-containing protein [bacterium]|nr:lytic transglycosylase domain-containing protein [bacterium]